MPFNSFPYVNLNDINLDFVLGQIHSLGNDVEAIKKYLEDLDLPQTVKDTLQEWLDNGTLLPIVEQALQAVFIPEWELYDQYADGVAETAVSYLCAMAPGTTDCVIGTPLQPLPFIAIYEDSDYILPSSLLKYNSLVNGDVTFGIYTGGGTFAPGVDGNHNTLVHNGTSYPVVYFTCSTFVTMMCKNRDYMNSPFYELFSNPSATARSLANKTIEKGSNGQAPWTMDFLNLWYSWRIADNMQSSGNDPHLIAHYDNGLVYDDFLDILKDGAILFQGNKNDYPDRNYGVFHCLLYFKTLDRLNHFANLNNGCQVKAYDTGSPDHGFIVHCSGSTDGQVHSKFNVLRIETLDHFLRNSTYFMKAGGAVYGCNPIANAGNSGKRAKTITGNMKLTDCYIINGYEGQPSDGSLQYNMIQPFVTGSSYPFNSINSTMQTHYSQPYTIGGSGVSIDLNEFTTPAKNGKYVIAVGTTIVNGPAGLASPLSSPLLLEVECYRSGVAVHTVTTMTNSTNHKYERSKGTTTFTEWQTLY